MPKLDKADAKAIYCYMTYIYENQLKESENSEWEPKVDYATRNFLERILEYHTDPDNSMDFNFALFKKKNTKRVYNFSLKVKNSKLVEISDRDYKVFMDYITADNGHFVPLALITNLKESIKFKSKPPAPDFTDAEFILQDTKWILYYKDFVNGHWGISCSLLLLNTFGRAMLYNSSEDSDLYQVYYGSFEIYQKNYLRLRFTVNQSGAKALKMTFYFINPDKSKLLAGLFSSINKGLFEGTILMERLAEDDVNDILKRQVKFYRFDKNNNTISSEIIKFLNKETSIIYLPEKVPTKESLGTLSKLMSSMPRTKLDESQS